MQQGVKASTVKGIYTLQMPEIAISTSNSHIILCIYNLDVVADDPAASGFPAIL
jgi:hypothetical protein